MMGKAVKAPQISRNGLNYFHFSKSVSPLNPNPTPSITMKNYTQVLLLFICLLFICNLNKAVGQTVTDSSSLAVIKIAQKKSYCSFSLGYLSNSVYYGRKDSDLVPYIIPAFRYADKSGFYAEASISYLSNKDSRIDMGAIGAGYLSYSRDSLFSLEFYANKYFTNSASYAVRSALKADVGANATYDFGLLSIATELYGILSNKADIITSFGLLREVNFGDDNEWSISPKAMINAGTSNFYSSYFTSKKYAARRKRRMDAGLAVITPIVVKQNFGILDYELSAPVEYETNKFGFFFTPTYTTAVHPATYSLNNGLTYKTEKLTSSFYVELGAYIKF